MADYANFSPRLLQVNDENSDNGLFNVVVVVGVGGGCYI